ncbi:TIGR03086 family metal-binding protein [Kitasatospora sp. NPDC006697]|uniref:TIGR03086 family metal-binding protein n=1 Tax=Kitasatospora sp. NPDC006697 TaxID=3364020 RepID=UPI0036CE0B5D
MTDAFDGILDRFLLASGEFERRLRAVRSEQWTWPTPCTEWNVRQLANHMTQGNRSYLRLLAGGDAAEFLRSRDADASGADPVGSYTASVRELAEAFGGPGALWRILDYPLGPVAGQQGLAVRTTDSLVHTWDLARAVGADETLDAGLVRWANARLEDIYAGLPETPTAADTTHRFFAAPEGVPQRDASEQALLLHRMGRQGT